MQEVSLGSASSDARSASRACVIKGGDGPVDEGEAIG